MYNYSIEAKPTAKEKPPARERFLLVPFSLTLIKENEHGVWGRDPTTRLLR